MQTKSSTSTSIPHLLLLPRLLTPQLMPFVDLSLSCHQESTRKIEVQCDFPPSVDGCLAHFTSFWQPRPFGDRRAITLIGLHQVP